MSQLTAIQKAKKILSAYDEIEPRKYCVQPHVDSNSKPKRPASSSASRSVSRSTSLRKDFSFCHSGRKEGASPARRQAGNSSFSSLYAR